MDKAIVLAVAASLCTATASVCQRKGARSTQTAGLDIWLVFRLARRPVWVLGIASMILGFVFQLTALHFGDLALVQPILAAELLFVFGYLAVAGSRRVRRRDWLAAAAMSAGIGLFLRVASPSGGRLHAPGPSWLLAGLVTAGVVSAALAVACGLGASGSRRAAVLGVATGISWGFMAAVIKEFSSHIDNGIGAVFCTWSLYVLITAGAATMLLASHALAAGPLAASQPGFTILDPFSASLLGVFLFGEHIRTGVTDLAGETLALGVVMVGATVLSRSCLITGENGRRSGEQKPAARTVMNSPLATRLLAVDPAGTGTRGTGRPRALRPGPPARADRTPPDPALVTAGRAAPPKTHHEIKSLTPDGRWPDRAHDAHPRGTAQPAASIRSPHHALRRRCAAASRRPHRSQSARRPLTYPPLRPASTTSRARRRLDARSP